MRRVAVRRALTIALLLQPQRRPELHADAVVGQPLAQRVGIRGLTRLAGTPGRRARGERSTRERCPAYRVSYPKAVTIYTWQPEKRIIRMPKPDAGAGKEPKAPRPPSSPRELEALRLLRDFAREGKHRPLQPPLRPKSGNRYIAS